VNKLKTLAKSKVILTSIAVGAGGLLYLPIHLSEREFLGVTCRELRRELAAWEQANPLDRARFGGSALEKEILECEEDEKQGRLYHRKKDRYQPFLR
jgi:hypothetical protein